VLTADHGGLAATVAARDLSHPDVHSATRRKHLPHADITVSHSAVDHRLHSAVRSVLMAAYTESLKFVQTSLVE